MSEYPHPYTDEEAFRPWVPRWLRQLLRGWNDGPGNYNCPNCGMKTGQQGDRSRRIYCSDDCMAVYGSEHLLPSPPVLLLNPVPVRPEDTEGMYE